MYNNPYQYPFQQQYPFGTAQQFPQQMQSQIANVLPAQQVLQANGKTSIDALRMAPNSSVLVMDTTAPLVWLCTSDGIGAVTSIAYDITPHKDVPPVDMNSVERRLSAVELNLSQMMEVMNHAKPDVGNAKPKQTIRNSGADRTD